MKTSILEALNSEYINDSQIKLIHDILNLNSFPDMSDLRLLAGISDDDWRHIDSATPCDANRQIENLYPNFRKGTMVYSYVQNRIFGEHLNLNDLIVKRIVESIS